MENKVKEVGIKEMADYKIYMMTEGYSNRTIVNYLTCLKLFMKYLEEKSIEKLSEVTPEVINQYRTYISLEKRGRDGGKLKAGSQMVIMLSVIGLFRFLVGNKNYLYDPTSHIRLKHPPVKRTRQVFTEKEMIRLLNAPNPETTLGLRDKALLELYYGCGIRNTESRLLTVSDIDLEERTVRIRHSKGGTGDEIIPMTKVAAHYLEEYIKNARPKLVKNDLEEILFLTYDGKPFWLGRPAMIVQKYAKIAKINRHVDAHSIRHTYATHLHDHGADIRAIQLLLRHKSINTTQIYVEVKAPRLRQVLEKTHPREKGIVYAPPVE